MEPRFRVLLVAGVGGAAVGCLDQPERPDEAVRAFLAPEARPAIEVSGRFLERGGPGILGYRGVVLDPERPKPGDVLMLTHVLDVEVPFASSPTIFVHFEDASGRRALVDDHRPIGGRVAFSAMRAGERWLDRHRVVLPETAGPGTLDVLFGVLDGDVRMTLEAKPGTGDGRDRLRVAQLDLAGSPAAALPTARVPRARGSIEPDGVLDEPDWTRAEALELTDSLGRGSPRAKTRVRLLYDELSLYVAFEADDPDITERYARRDDPIYEHEAVELFLMPNVAPPSTGPYVELQASPGGVVFDASFQGPRLGMRTAWDAEQRVGTQVDGTLNDPAPDRGWTSEWAVPWASIPGVERAPEPGDAWRMNLFRIEKRREGARLVGEYTAWSPPLVGDFHAVDRFGRLEFGDR